MAGMVCSKCDVDWKIHSHEQYCGYCGCKTYDFSVKWKEEPLLYTSDGTDTRELTILVENDGACPITFQPIQTKREKAIQFSEKYKEPFQIKAGQSHAIAIQVNSANLARYPEIITVRSQEALPNLEGEKSLTLRALPRPDFKLLGSIDVSYRKGMEKVTLDLHVEVLQSQFYINDIKILPGWVRRVGFSRERHEKNSSMRNIRLEIDCKQLSDGLNSETLSFELRGFPRAIEKQIRIQAEALPEPPRLFVPKMNLEVTQDREKNYTLTLQNRGEDLLTVRDITLSDPLGLTQLPNANFPINIKGGEHQSLDVLVSADGIKPATYPINFTITSNCETSLQHQDVLNVTVKQREEYPYYLAIDFGTTNSCCAYIDLDTFEPKLIPLDSKANPPDIMPSSIVYPSRITNGKVFQIGYEANNLWTSPTDGIYCIHSVKRWLGYEWARQFPNNLKLQPRDVVANILKHIIEQAENHLDTLTKQSKITKCVITHPTMFRREQREDLKLAFEKIGITDLILIDEASAASIGTIFQERGETLPENHRLLVYDFGGGTIDIVLAQVTRDGNAIKIEPLARGGTPKYGGDDVTQAIVNVVLDECEERIRSKNSDIHQLNIPYFKLRKTPKLPGNPEIDRAAHHNTPILYNRAEEMKKELNERTEINRDFPLSVVVENAIVRPLENLTQNMINVKLSAEKLQSLIKPTLNETFAEIDVMIAENGGRLPDTVILAGQSSKMPAVKNTMKAHFQEKYNVVIDIPDGEHPKACVVIGAAQYGKNRSLSGTEGGEIQPIDLENKTHSPIPSPIIRV